MFRYFLYLWVCLAFCYHAQAQKENYQWVFGHLNGLDFNSGAPVFFSSEIQSAEGAAAVSDKNGNLLFYSDGKSVWDAHHDIMPNGTGLLGNGPASSVYPGSSTQGVAIAQKPGKPQQYYIFVLEAAEDIIFPPHLPASLRYTVVDMSLNSGRGDVVATDKNIVLDIGIGEQMCLSRGDGCYCWLIVHSRNEPVYKAFKIDATGIHPPVESAGIYNNYQAGEMKVSPDETRIAAIVHTTADTFDIRSAIELGSFNKATGVISNIIALDVQNPSGKYGLSFSPDNSKLYSGNLMESLVQHDISGYPDAALVNSSKTEIAAGRFAGMRIGPDQKIYIMPFTPDATPYIARINDPDLAGAACNFDYTALQMPAGSFFPLFLEAGRGLGNPVVVLNGDVDAEHTASERTLCPGDSIMLSVRESYTHFAWENGSTSRDRLIREAGSYWVTEQRGCAVAADTFKVYMSDPTSGILEPDTSLCSGATVSLHTFSGMESRYLWSDGSADPVITVSGGDVYHVAITNSCGTFLDSIHIGWIECSCKPFMPNAFTPNQDGRNDIFRPEISCPLSYYAFSIYNRYGQRIFLSRELNKGWDGTHKGRPADNGTYFYYISYRNTGGESFSRKGDITLIR